MCICETHLSGKEKIYVPGYIWYGHNRKTKHIKAPYTHGGVGILVKESLLKEFHVSEIDKSFDGILGLLFKHVDTEYSFINYVCYLPPDKSAWSNPTDFYGHLTSQLYLNNDVDVIYLCGDFNSRIGSRDDIIVGVDDVTLPLRKATDQNCNQYGEQFLDFLRDMKLCIVNGRVSPENDGYTCLKSNGMSVVDYFIVPHISLPTCAEFTVIPVSQCLDSMNLYSLISKHCKPPDHSLLKLDFVISNCLDLEIIETTENHNYEVPVSNKKYKMHDMPEEFQNNERWYADLERIIQDVENCRQRQCDIDDVYMKFCECLSTEMDCFLKPSGGNSNCKKRFKYYKPYWDEELTRLWKDMHDCEKQFARFSGNRHEKLKRKNNLQYAQKRFDKALRKKERMFNRNKIEELERVQTSDPKSFWKHVESLGVNMKKNIPMTVYENGSAVSDEDIVLNRWKEDFCNLYNRPEGENDNFDNVFHESVKRLKANMEEQMNAPGYTENVFLNDHIGYDEIEKVIEKLKGGKAMGIDFIPNEVLKSTSLIFLLWKLMTKLFEYSLVPSVWLRAIIAPIPKGGATDPYLPLNYRGISLLSTVAKVYSSFLNTRLYDYFDIMGFIADEQNGFRPQRSCLDHAFSLSTLIKNRISNKQSTFVAFIDFEKAFDWIDRELLLYKLLTYNVDGKFYNAIKSLYFHSESCIRINKRYTDWFTTETGVRQGDVLSPTLFNIYINDLISGVKQLNCGIHNDFFDVSIFAYADDIAIVSNNEENLQRMLDYIYNWCAKWRMKCNIDKTKIMHFREKRKRITNCMFKFGQYELNIVKSYKYLGFYFDENLDYEFGIKTLAQSGGRALGAVIAKFKGLRDAGFSTFTKLYESCVVPITDYFSGIWGFVKTPESSKIHNRAMRHFLGVHSKTPIFALQGDIGWMLPKFRHYVNMFRLWNRLIKCDENRIVKKIFLWDYSQVNGSWTYEFVQICHLFDIDTVFQSLSLVNIKRVIEVAKVLQNTEWKANVTTKPKLRTYVKFKENCETETYVTCMISKGCRSLLAQFRSGILPLTVETGRYGNVPLNNRLCPLCSLNVVEDEFHFLCVCPIYNEFREALYNHISLSNEHFRNMPDDVKFITIMASDQRKLATYIYESWCKRRSLLYV